MSDESYIDDLGRFEEIFGDLDLTVLKTDKWYPVFVYGTMLRGERNHFRLDRADVRFFSPAKTEFYNFSFGTRYAKDGKAIPAAVKGGHIAIAGELYYVKMDVLLLLDMYEGHPSVYRREFVDIISLVMKKKAEFSRERAYMYLYQGSADELYPTHTRCITRIYKNDDSLAHQEPTFQLSQWRECF